MNDLHDMGNRPVAPSVSPLVRQAARNLCHLEFLAENPVWTHWLCRRNFWRTRRMMAMTPDEAAAWLPAVAVAVQRETETLVFEELTHWPIPEPLPPEALPWRDALIQSWEQHPAATDWNKSFRLSALVRLDRRVERLPEWLRKARRARDLVWYDRYLRLAALAGWRPRPGDAPPHGGKRGAAQAWVRFWEERYRTPGSELDGLIAAAALLHLAEAGWLPSGPSPERLREEFRQWVRQYPFSYDDRSVLRMLLSSIPADVSTPERWRQDITGWLELTRKDVDWKKREDVWEMLAAWKREGVPERSGRGRLPGRGRLREPPLLLPVLARVLKWECNDDVLLAMAGYVPEAAEVSAHPKAARAVIAHWEALSRGAFFGGVRQAAWVARWNLMRAGVLTAEEQGRFGADDVEAIGAENDPDVLLALAQITPPGTFPLATWAGRLSDQDDRRRLAAGLAIHGWLVDMAGGGQRIASSEQRVASSDQPLATRHSPLANSATRHSPLASEPLATRQYGQFPELPLRLAITRRQVRQALRRAGQEGMDAGTVAPFVNLPPEVWPDFRRLREIETALAAGHLPPSPDAGAGNRPIPRTVPARLPESHLRTGPPGITDRTTGRTAGSEPPARHPFPEVIRHE
jgi:hypothetical protein